MATVEKDIQSDSVSSRITTEETSFLSAARQVLTPLASLKLTVVLFALSIFIVLAGTLAQVDKDIWAVINEYFRIDFTRLTSSAFPWIHPGELFTWIDFQIFVPPAFCSGNPPDLPSWLGIWFPKGWTIGAVMMLNLFAAHAVRFKMQAKGARLAIGWATILFGCLVTTLVIKSGSNPDGLQSETWLSYDVLWKVMQVSLLALTGLSTVYAFNTAEGQRNVRWLLAGTAGLFALIELSTFVVGPFDDSSMRILYQVLKATLAALILLAGCILVFRKRGGIVLLHGGIGLMMVFDVLVGTAHVESRMLIEEGQTVQYSEDIRTVELAVVDKSDESQDVHTIIPARLLETGATLSDDHLPFDVRVVDYFPNSDLQRLDGERGFLAKNPDFENPVTDGVGKRFAAVEVKPTSGTDTEATVDHPSAYIELLNKSTGESLGTYVASVWMKPPYFFGEDQTIDVDGHEYDVSLRFKRLYKPYEVTLVDVQKNDYAGTSSPRDYRSILKIADSERGSTFEYPVWMNNPLRYGGETFYQSSFHPAGSLPSSQSKEATTLQVVSNTGWMVPYVACMIVVVGMLAQFTLTLLRFLSRRLSAFDQMRKVESPDGIKAPGSLKSDKRSWLVPVVAVVLTGTFIAMFASPRRPKTGEPDIAAFGELPVIDHGRPQPFDSLARNALIALSDRQTFKHDRMDGKERSKSAVNWLLDVIAKPIEAAEHQVFRIESVEMVDLLGLERRPGSWTYSLAEFQEKWSEMRPQLEAAVEADQSSLTLIQRKQLELQRKVSLYDRLQTGFRDLADLTPPLPSQEDMQANKTEAIQQLMAVKTFMEQANEGIPRLGFPLAVPTHVERSEQSFAEMQEADWVSYPLASIYATMDERLGREMPPAFAHLRDIFAAHAKGDASAFNTAVAEYRDLLESVTIEKLTPPNSAKVVDLKAADFEAYYNGVAPFNLASWIYVVAFVLVAMSWLVWTRPLNNAAFWVIVTTFVLHTLAIIGRIYISGRPPVTNLYSSAVFIGWAGVLFGIGLEMVYRLGVGNVIAAVTGFLTLRIAHGLAMDGDTFGVLEAVLDTQFWLATHVVCVTLGYAATYVSGLLGLVTILRGVLTKSLSSDEEQTLTRMNYGVLCFAIFFSFFGTVLGGLWADDSWGRFWGWDPKENGALIIVLWNALVLHARWGGMVKSRGLAVLTVLGNIVVSWSWFGVNELNVGLHSYGFTEGRLAMLGLFCASQLLVVAVGCLPQGWWRSRGLSTS
ncbi:MAG: cytochrome c biogenesis protein CcsA [Planctomycetaceae bacterium]